MRHAQSIANIDGSVYKDMCQTEIPLSQYGRNQCSQIREALKKELVLNQKTLCISSPLKRAKETAELVCDRTVGIEEDPLLVEQWWGSANGFESFEAYIEKNPDETKILNTNSFFYYAPPRGESLFDVYKRVILFFSSHEWFRHYVAQNILIVTHCSVAHMIDTYLSKLKPDKQFMVKPSLWKNCQVKIYELEKTRPILNEWTFIKEIKLF